MGEQTRRLLPRQWLLLLPFLLCVFFSGCVHLVDTYDAASVDQITTTAQDVLGLYDRIIETPESSRKYDSFAADYGKIETELRVLQLRQQARPLNSESTAIVGTILDQWTKYRDAHKAQNTVPTVLAKLHRDRFQRLFAAALMAQRANAIAGEQD